MYKQMQFTRLENPTGKDNWAHTVAHETDVQVAFLRLFSSREGLKRDEEFTPDCVICNPRTLEFTKAMIKNLGLRIECVNKYGRELTVVVTREYENVRPVALIMAEQRYWKSGGVYCYECSNRLRFF